MLNQKQFGCLKFLSVNFNDTQVCKGETSQSHNNFFPLFSITFLLSHLSVYHFVPSGDNPLSIAYCTANTFNALPCLLTYSDPAIVLHPASRC